MEERILEFSFSLATKDRLQSDWEPFTKVNASWLLSRSSSNKQKESTGDDRPDVHIHGPRRALLYQIATCLDVNECGLEFLSFQSASERN